MTETTLAAMLQAELERGRQARVSELGAVALAWLAFPPVWTDRLARACGFPAGPIGLEELLRRAEAAGWCERRETEIRARTPALRLHLQVELNELDPVARLNHRLIEPIEAIEDESLRAHLLTRLAATAPDEDLQRIWRSGRRVSDPRARAELLLTIAERVPDHPALRAALTADELGLTDQPVERTAALLRLWKAAPDPDPAWRDEILATIGQLDDQVVAARLLKKAAQFLPSEAVAPLVPRRVPELPAVGRSDLAVAAAWTGKAGQALDVAASITDPRIRLHTCTELLVPVSRVGDQALLTDAVRRCTGDDRLSDALTMAKVVERLAGAGLAEDAERLAYRLVLAARELRATPANVSALQRAAAAVMAAQAGGSGLTLVRRSAELAGQLANPADRVTCLADAVDLARQFGLPYPLDTTPVVDAARAVHDDEDRARVFAQAALLVGGDEGATVAQEALDLAGQLDEGATVVTFWAPDGMRDEILEELRRRLGFTTIRQLTVAMGWSIKGARRRGELVPEAMARWEELAAAADVQDRAHRAPAVLDERMSQLLAAGDTGQAFAWLDTAKSLAPLLLGVFETSVVANTRRVELYHRQEQDRRRLAEFLPRAEQLRAFEALLNQSVDGPWALHYLGVGGVGKTTLIRHLTAQLAPERDVVTSRIDFDHINPDFPRRRPAQLLLELATELEPRAQGRRQMTLFRQAYEQLQEINAAALPGAAPITVTDSRFASAVRTFGGFLQTLERPVVLILDTCEELEKFTPVGGRIEQLEAAFALIEALHAAVPRLRVVLAGRRPLARAGHGWRLAAAEGAEALEVMLPDHKPYLMVHEVRGFSRAEAAEFLDPGHKGLDLSPEMFDAILSRSPDAETPAALERTADTSGVAQSPSVTRYNPFDLDHYANWIRADPSLTAADVASTDRDTYVESRIIGRLNHADVERLLPAVAAVGRFDRGMLRPAFDGDEQAFVNVWRELSATEWVDIQFDAALDTTFLEVDRRLRPRLASYYERSENRGLRHEAARRLGPGLEQLCDERPTDQLGFDHVAAALRLLPADEAARLVDRLAWKVIEEAAWGWAERVVERVLADQPELGRRGHPAAAGLRAMLASALVHLDPERDLTDLWMSVEEAARAHPDEQAANWLVSRANVAQGEAIGGPPLLAKTATRNEDLRGWVLEALAETADEGRRQVLLGGLLAAVQERLDEEETVGNRIRLLDPADLERAVLAEPPAVRAYVRMLSARVLLLDARFDEAAQAFGEAVTLVSGAGTDFSPWLLADWQLPDDLVERVWLEALRAPIPDVGRPALGPPPVPNDHLGGIDADRLASAALRRRLGREVVPAEELAAYEQIDDLLETRRPVCKAHRAVPPFFITVAYGWMARGDAERARELLIRGEEAAIAGRDPATVRRVAAARLDTVRRFRHGTWDWSLLVQLMDSGGAEQENALATATLAGPRQIAPPAVDLVVPESPPTVSDWFENDVLSQWERRVREKFIVLGEQRDRGNEPRRRTLSEIQIAGPRRVAALLLEDGELLALRGQPLATDLLVLAATLFEESGDSFGAFAATVTAALARGRAGMEPGDDAASRLRRSYEGLRRECAPRLPEWEALLPVVTDSGHGVGLPADPVWEGWLNRLLWAMAWAIRPEVFPRLAEAVAAAGGHSPELAFPRANRPDSPDAAQPPSPAQTPPSLRGAPPVRRGSPPGFEPLSGRAPRGDDYSPDYGPSPQKRRFSFGLERLLGWIGRWGVRRRALSPVTAAIGIAAVALVTWFVAQPLARIGGEPRTSSPASADILRWVLVGLGAVAVGAGVMFLLRRWLRALRGRAAASYGSLDIGAIAHEGGILQFTPYERQRHGLLEQVRRAAASTTARGLELFVPSHLVALPWEAPVLLGLDDPQAPCWRRRTSPVGSAAPRSRWWDLRRVRWFQLVPETWMGLTQEALGQSKASWTRLPLPQAPEDWVLLLTGTPVETTAGLRLSTQATTSEEPISSEALIGHDTVPYPRFGLAVIMGEPVEALARVDAEREQTSRLRRFAADALDAGAPAAICLPSMPEDVARQVLTLLNRRLRRIRRRGSREIIATTSRIRGIIAAAGTTDEERAAAKELALEVTVWPA